MKTFISHQLNQMESSRHVPMNILNQKETIFRNIKDVITLHESVLPGLRSCDTDDDVAMFLLRHSDHFDKYLPYLVGQAQAEACVTDKATQQYFKELSQSGKSDLPVMDVLTFLQRPVERMQTYQGLLKLIKNKAKSGQSCSLLEDAFSMVSCLPWRSDNLHQVSLIENYPAPLTALGEPVRQGVFTVWEDSTEVRTASRGHQRQVFVFRECIVLCKVKRDLRMNSAIYSFKNKMKLNDVEIKEMVGGDERSWGLWHEHRGSVRRYTLQGRSAVAKLPWIKDLKKLQQCSNQPVNPPVFESLLCDCTTKMGQTIKLTCKITGSPKPVVGWFKGLPLEDDPRHIITSDRAGSYSLVLDSLTCDDSGQYTCYATNSVGSAGSLAKVIVQPPRFVSRLESSCLIEGEDLQFTCSTFSTPFPQIWLKDGKELTDQQKYLIQNDSRSGILSLTVIRATAADIGQYECELSNEFGCIKCRAGLCPAYVPPTDVETDQPQDLPSDSEGWSTTFVKQWLQTDFSPTSLAKMLFPTGHSDPPSIQVPIEDLYVQPGQAATFTAVITGRPAPNIQWFKDEDELEPDGNMEMVQQGARCSLTILSSEGEDSGTYTCLAFNTSGHVCCQAQLVVEEPLEYQEREVELGKRRKLFTVYDIHEEIGRGAFGVVKRVVHRRTNEVFAAKFLPLQSSTRTRAFQERDLLSRLAHPRVACLLDFFCTRRTLVLITESCCSHGLLDHLLLKGSVSEKEVQSFIQQILEGVGHIHSMNIMHLDIKPENILMVYPPRDEIKICDFGFCQEIDTSRHQYSLFGTPEFTAPEVVHQEPVTVVTDIAVGVMAFLLVCRCPFSGDTDRATLLRVGEGTLNWDAPDVTKRSPEAQNFLHLVLQTDPRKRPSAFECLSHDWFQGEDTDEINTRNLKGIISKRKWQRSLTCIGSVLMLRPIPELLDAPLRETAVTVPRELHEHSSTSPSSSSSSEYDEADSWDFFQHYSPTEEEEEEETEEEYDPLMERAQIPAPFAKLHPLGAEDEDDVTLGEEEDGLIVERRRTLIERSTSRQSVVSSDESGQQTPQRERRFSKGSTPSLCMSDFDEGSGSDGGLIPRGSVIRSTFYNTSHQLSPLSARHMTLRDKFQAKKQERGRKPLRRSLSGRLNEPLIEYVEDETETIRGQRRGSVQPSIQKSCSFDSGVGLAHMNLPPHRRSRSLDGYSRRSPSPVRRTAAVEEGAQSLKEDFTDGEVAKGNFLAIPSPRRLTRLHVRPNKPDVLQLDGGGLLVVWRPVKSSDPVTYCLQYCTDGDWTVVSEELTDSCYIVKDLPPGASYVFRVGCISRTGAGPFSDASAPFVTATQTGSHMSLIHTESLRSKGTGSEEQPPHKSYNFLSEINGRFSVITLCRNVETSQVFAAKITPYQPQQRQLVLSEYQLLKRLHHPHLVQLHTAFITTDYMVLVEELCPGKELLYSLALDLYTEGHVAELLFQILSAVDYLHSRRVVHLDLKSDNMLVDDCDHLKIVDLGSAQSFSPGQPLNIEHIEGLMESKLPKAPEILEGNGVGPETDVWAVGVLSFILSADSPFHAENSLDQDKNIKKGKIQFGRCYPGLSEGALNFMKSSLNNKSRARPTAAECLQNTWLRAHRGPLRARLSKVCFSTDKLKEYLKQKEEKREVVRTKIQ
uniref:Obscurin, cytoskeletal calmodulin and titin-interacting RhoGEF a n=1 Tax=Cynoglossus semilaevis TaxID=244447 RepID=A0A3P8W6V9_CYNSE